MKRIILMFMCLLLIGCQKVEVDVDNTPVVVEEVVEIEPPDTDTMLINYLQDNYTDIAYEDLEMMYDELLSMLLPVLDDYDIFLTGELHRVGFNRQLQLAFIKFLYEHADMRYVLIEESLSIGKMLNEYIQTGNEALLNLIMRFKFEEYRSEEHYQFYQALYEYNLTLPEDDKLMLFGVDAEMSLAHTYHYMDFLMPDIEPPAEIHEAISAIKVNKIYQSQVLEADVEAHGLLYKEYLGDNYNDFMDALNNAVASRENRYGTHAKSNDYGRMRDGIMYKNVMTIAERYPKKKMFGQFGTVHIYQQPVSSAIFNDLAMRLAGGSDSPFKNRVLSIPFIYENPLKLGHSYEMGYVRARISSRITTVFEKQKLMKDIVTKDITLFRITSDGSPFHHEPFSNAAKIPIADCFQFAMYLKDSPSEIPLDEAVYMP